MRNNIPKRNKNSNALATKKRHFSHPKAMKHHSRSATLPQKHTFPTLNQALFILERPVTKMEKIGNFEDRERELSVFYYFFQCGISKCMPDIQFYLLIVNEELLYKLYLKYQAEVVFVFTWLSFFTSAYTCNLD